MNYILRFVDFVLSSTSIIAGLKPPALENLENNLYALPSRLLFPSPS